MGIYNQISTMTKAIIISRPRTRYKSTTFSFFLLMIPLIIFCIGVNCAPNTAETNDYTPEFGLLRKFAHHSISHSHDIGSQFFSAGNAVAGRLANYRRSSPTTINANRRYASAPLPVTAPLPPLPPPPLPAAPPVRTSLNHQPHHSHHSSYNTSNYESTCDCRSVHHNDQPNLAPTTAAPLQYSTLATTIQSATANPSGMTTTGPASVEISDEMINTRIVNGSKADLNSFPYLVSLGRAITNRYNNQSHYCGGALINSRWVLTAAHCISDFKPKKLLVAMGSNDRNRMRAIVEASSTVVHPDYSGWPDYANDIALIKLKYDVRFSQYIRPGCLHLQRLRFNGILTGVGWGQVAYSGNYPNDLQKVTFNYIRHVDCKQSWSKESGHPPVTKQHICVHNQYSDICGGDSGSPLIYQTEGRDFIVGVASFTNYCDKTQPAVYMRIYPYTNWILSIIRDYCT